MAFGSIQLDFNEYLIINNLNAFPGGFPKVMMTQPIPCHSLQRLEAQSLVHHLEQFHHGHRSNKMPFHAVAKLVLLSHHIDNHIEGKFILFFFSSLILLIRNPHSKATNLFLEIQQKLTE